MHALTVSSPGRPDLHGCQVVVGNGRNYGGRFTLFPEAKQNDGLLDVVVLRGDANLWQAVQVLRGALFDGYGTAEDVDYVQLPEFTVNSTGRTAVELDGELCGEAPVKIRKAAFSLRIAALDR
jgi:diacylglycerol kinase family enzyme